METNTVVGLIVVIVIGLGLAGLSVPLLMGKCAGLVAGYSTMSPKERESWDGPALARFTGKILLTVAVLTLTLMPVILVYDALWLTVVYILATVGLGVFAAVRCNTGARFRK